MAWQKQGSTTLGSSSTNIEVDPTTPKEFNQILLHEFRSGVGIKEDLSFNNDTGNNYAWRFNKNGGTDTTVTNDGAIQLQAENQDDDGFSVISFINISDQEKIGIAFSIDRNDVGAGNVPQRKETVFKHVNTSSQDDQIDVDTDDIDTFEIDSNLSVLGDTVGSTETFTVDSCLQEQAVDKTFIVDGIILDMPAKAYCIDSVLQASVDKTFIVDALLQLTSDENFTLDALLQLTSDEIFTIDAVVVSRNTEDLALDVLLQVTLDETFTTDAILQSIFDEVFSVDTILKATQLFNFTIDGLLQETSSKLFAVDSMLRDTFDENFTIDSLTQTQNIDETLTVDAFIQKPGSLGACGINSFSQLKAYYNFDESSGDLINQAGAIGSVDTLGTSADGTVGSDIDRQQTGQVVNSYLFEGATESQSGNKITLGSSKSQFNFMHGPTSNDIHWTWVAWIKPSSTPKGDIFNSKNNTGSPTGSSVTILSDSRINLAVRGTSGAEIIDKTTTQSIPTNQFTMVVVRYDHSTGSAKISFNADLANEETLTNGSGSPTSANANHPMIIGTRNDPQSNVTYDGEMDEMSFWDRILTDEEVNQLFVTNTLGQPLQTDSSGLSCFSIDSLTQASPQIPLEFTVDAKIVREIKFSVDLIVETFGTERSNVGDVIIRVLQENPPSLTGLEIVDKVVEKTQVTEAGQHDFVGKTSRIKNWIGFLDSGGIITDDDSSPDWYKTNWSLV